jgi:hypothetical protein
VSSDQLLWTDAAAVNLLMSLVETPTATISGEILEGHFPSIATALKDSGLLQQGGEQRTATSLADHDDEPVHLIWSAEHESYGYFSPASAWVTPPSSQLRLHRVNLERVFGHIGSKLEWGKQAPPVAVVPDLLWELGDARLPGRRTRVPVWIARRLSDPSVWQQFLSATRLRPAPGLRIVLSCTSADRLPAQVSMGHEIIAIQDVAANRTLLVDPDLLAARIRSGNVGDETIKIVADGAVLIVRGKRYLFGGSKQREIIRHLCEARSRGEPECLTAEVLEKAECAPTVNTLAKAFSGREDWREIIEEAQGCCWLLE